MNYKIALANKYSLLMRGIRMGSYAQLFLNE